MQRILGLVLMFASTSAFANTVSIATGVVFDENFDAACDSRVQEISSAVANDGISVTKNVWVDTEQGQPGPHCEPYCGPVIRNKICNAVLTSSRGELSVHTAKIGSLQCNASLSPQKDKETVYQNVYSEAELFKQVCVIDTIDLSY